MGEMRHTKTIFIYIISATLSICLSAAIGWTQEKLPTPVLTLYRPDKIRILSHAASATEQLVVSATASRLQQELCVPVTLERSDFDLGPNWNSAVRKVDVGGLMRRMITQFPESRTVNILFISQDVYDSNEWWIYLLDGTVDTGEQAQSWSVISLASIRVPHERAPTPLNTERSYKLALRDVGHAAGLDWQAGCILSPAGDLPELDALPDRFCAEQEEALIKAKILGHCNDVSTLPMFEASVGDYRLQR